MFENLSEIAVPYISQLLDISDEETKDLIDGNKVLTTTQVDKLASLFGTDEEGILNGDMDVEDLKNLDPRDVKAYAKVMKIARNSKELNDLISHM